MTDAENPDKTAGDNTEAQQKLSSDKSITPNFSTDAVPQSPNKQSAIDRAEALVKKIEEGNAKTEELIRRQEEILSYQRLAGRAEAGIAPKSQEQILDEEVKKVVDKYY